MIVHILCRINVDGQWWDIEIEHNILTTKPGFQKKATIEKVILGLKGVGIISSVGGKPEPTEPIYPPRGTSDQPVDLPPPAYSWPTPECPIHREPMSASKVQRKTGKHQMYCTQQADDGYCKHRASVDEVTGMPSFYEVK